MFIIQKDEYQVVLEHQNNGGNCKYCGSPSGHFSVCALVTGSFEPETAPAEHWDTFSEADKFIRTFVRSDCIMGEKLWNNTTPSKRAHLLYINFRSQKYATYHFDLLPPDVQRIMDMVALAEAEGHD